MEQLLSRLRHGRVRRVAFTVPAGEAWSLPAYELALLTEAELERKPGTEAELEIVTAEATPLQVFGRGASEGVAALLAERGIRFYGGERPIRFERGRLEVVPRSEIESDAVDDLDPQPFDPVLRAELWTGRDRRYLEGWLGGGHGEGSTFAAAPPWGESRGKIVGCYPSGFLAGLS